MRVFLSKYVRPLTHQLPRNYQNELWYALKYTDWMYISFNEFTRFRKEPATLGHRKYLSRIIVDHVFMPRKLLHNDLYAHSVLFLRTNQQVAPLFCLSPSHLCAPLAEPSVCSTSISSVLGSSYSSLRGRSQSTFKLLPRTMDSSTRIEFVFNAGMIQPLALPILLIAAGSPGVERWRSLCLKYHFVSYDDSPSFSTIH